MIFDTIDDISLTEQCGCAISFPLQGRTNCSKSPLFPFYSVYETFNYFSRLSGERSNSTNYPVQTVKTRDQRCSYRAQAWTGISHATYTNYFTARGTLRWTVNAIDKWMSVSFLSYISINSWRIRSYTHLIPGI